MKRPLTIAALFVSPLILAIIIELFILPMDFFTFRAWEALLIKKRHAVLRGPFYPRQHIARIEVGDLGPRTAYAVTKNVVWDTDRYGYRKKEPLKTRYPIVLVGDSCVGGTGLTQSDLLSEVLGRMVSRDVYPLGPANINTFLEQERFRTATPDVVILVRSEHFLVDDLPAPAAVQEKVSAHVPPYGIQYLSILLDRLIYKNVMLNFLRARIIDRQRVPLVGKDNKTLFSNFGGVPVTDARITEMANTLVQHDKALKARSIRFIFVAVPNKESICRDLLPGPAQGSYLPRLNRLLEQKGVKTIDLYSTYQKEYQARKTALYLYDDTHWNAEGVRLAAKVIKNSLK